MRRHCCSSASTVLLLYSRIMPLLRLVVSNLLLSLVDPARDTGTLERKLALSLVLVLVRIRHPARSDMEDP